MRTEANDVVASDSQDLTIDGKIEAAPDSPSAHAESTEACEEMFLFFTLMSLPSFSCVGS